LPVVCFQSDHIRFLIVRYVPWVAKQGRKTPGLPQMFKNGDFFPKKVSTQKLRTFV